MQQRCLLQTEKSRFISEETKGRFMEEAKYIDEGTDFKNHHFSGELIIGCMIWYLKYPISYRNLEEMMLERGGEVDYTTIYRWVQKYAPEFHKRIRWYSQLYSGNWRVDETYNNPNCS